MRKIVLFLLLAGFLKAEPYYVNVMTTSIKDQLHSVSYQLDMLGYQKYLTQNSKDYVLYVGPFNTSAQANSAKSKIYREIGIKNMKIIEKNPTQAVAIPIQSSSTKEVILKEKPIIVVSSKYSKYFIGVNAGASNVNNEQDIISGSIVLDHDIADRGVNYGAELGYYIDKNIFMTLNYQLISLDDINLNNIYATLNYEFLRDEILSPYMGIIAGYSLLDWSTYPIASIEKDETSGSLMTGVQIGTNIMVSSSINLFASYQFWMMDHKTKLENSQGQTQIYHDFVNNITLGIRYKF